jgi:hypothetical protein
VAIVVQDNQNDGDALADLNVLFAKVLRDQGRHLQNPAAG